MSSQFLTMRIVAKDKEWLDLGDLSAVIDNLTLPTKGAAGSDISWASSDEDVIATDGTVTRPTAGDGDAVVTLTATLTSGDASDTKTFEVTVKQQLTAEVRPFLRRSDAFRTCSSK